MSAALSFEFPRETVPAGEPRFPGETPAGKVQLDAAVEDIRRLTRSADKSRWQVAELLSKIEKEDLWLHRKGCTSFKQLIESETDLSDSYASRLLAAFDFGQEAFEKHGLRKLYAISTAPEEAHARLLAACDGAKVVEIEAMAKAARPARAEGEPVPGRPAKPTTNEVIIEARAIGEGRFAGSEVLPDGRRIHVSFAASTEAIFVEVTVKVEAAS